MTDLTATATMATGALLMGATVIGLTESAANPKPFSGQLLASACAKARQMRLGLVALCVVSLGFGMFPVVAAGAPLDGKGASLDGKEAPDFALKTLDNRNLRLSEFRGQVVLINFWASWCGACRQAMPALNKMHDKYQRAGLVMLSINLDDEAPRALQMAKSLDIAYPVMLDDHKTVSRLYQVDNMPLTVLVDREGVVRLMHEGFNLGDESKFVAPLRSLLNE